jgi:hypothetical protein
MTPSAWSTKDGTEASSIGTWENPDRDTVSKPERNAQANNWNKPSGNGKVGNWTNNEGNTPDKQTGNNWTNETNAELSPGSAWKKEPSFVGNWADAVPSPRSDLEDNPLNSSLEEKKSLHRQLGNQPNSPW